MRIAICEDNKVHRDEIILILNEISPNDRPYGIKTFESGDALWFYYQDSEGKPGNDPPFDLIIMDIKLPGDLNGIDTAKLIHKQHERVMISLLTSYPQYALDGYGAEPIAYMLKPVKKQALIELIQKAEQRAAIRWQDCLNYELAGGYLRFPFSKIVYIESIGHHVYIRTDLDCDPERIYTKLSKVFECCDERFLECHKSYVINADYIEAFEYPYKKVILRKSNDERVILPISQLKQSAFRKALKEYDLWHAGLRRDTAECETV